VNDLHAAALAGTFHDAGPAGDYGSAAVNAYKQTPGYKQAVISTYLHQSSYQRQAIVSGALHNTASPEGKMILDYVKSQSGAPSWATAAIHSPGSAAIAAIKAASGPIDTILSNAAMDAANLPAEALSTIAANAKGLQDVLTPGRTGKGLSEEWNITGKPYVQLAEHPKMALQHPLDTYLMLAGPVHGAARLAAAPIRALAPESALGKVVSTERPGVTLSGNLTHERPPYSPSPTVKGLQVLGEKLNYTRNAAGEIVPRSQHLRDHQTNLGVSELVGVQERIRRVNRAHAEQARSAAITPGVATRVAGATKSALKYNPDRPLIPGAEVLTRVADGTIRRPDTYTADLVKHAQQVAANRPHLARMTNGVPNDPLGLAWHDNYVNTLTDEAARNRTPKQLNAIFEAAKQYGKDYRPVQAQAHALGHYGDMTAEQLQRRELAHYAITHMPGVRYNDVLGMVRDATKDEVRAYRDPLIQAANKLESKGATQKAAGLRAQSKEAWNEQAVPISNHEIINHLNGPEGTGGRMPVFTSDRVRFDREAKARSARYVGERVPLPNVKKNRMYAFTHGLTDPGHTGVAEQHVMMQGVVDALHAERNRLDTLKITKPDGSLWDSYEAAKRDGEPHGWVPIDIAQMFHPQGSLDKLTEEASPATVETEAMRRGLDLHGRMQPHTGGRWALIDPQAARALRQFTNQISPSPFLRTIRGLNNQFRTVALSTSARHVPGVAQENLIRQIANGIGFRSWLTGRRILARGPEDARTALTGGQAAGMTEAGKTYMVSDHWRGTSMGPALKAMEAVFKAPGARQMRTAWKAYTHFTLGTTKHLLEQQMQIASLGKAALREHGYADAARADGFMGLAKRAMGLHGQLLDDAARGLHDPAKLRQLRSQINRMAGKWTDLSPSAQHALMFSPFGLWWINSARFILRMPVDQPVATGLLAAQTVGTEKERQKEGLDLFSKGHLPLFMQGGIPAGGKILGQNYYSPFGIANDPLATAQSLFQPWATPLVTGSLSSGVNWLGKPLSAPGLTKTQSPSLTQKGQYILDSALSSFMPFYLKAKQVAEGGASPYDVSPGGLIPPLLRGQAPATKSPGQGPLAGLKKSALPFRAFTRSVGGSSGARGASPSGLTKFGAGGGGGGGGVSPSGLTRFGG
jgi:hypothetical protein